MKLFAKIIKDKILRKLLLIIFFIKLSIILVIFLGYHLFPFCTFCHDKNFVYPEGEKISLETAYKTWDGQHYIFLAERGYLPGQSSNAFYPLFPFLIRAFRVFGGSSLMTGLVLSNLFSFMAIIFFYLLVKKLFNAETAFLSVLFFQAFPTAFYMSLIYAESLFLMLVFAFFYFLYQRKFFSALLPAFLLPLSRPQGILMLIPLGIFLLNQKLGTRSRNKFGMTVSSFKEKQTFVILNLFQYLKKEYLLLIAFCLGILSYFGIMYYYTDSFFSGFAIHKYFISKRSFYYLFNLIDWFMRNFVFTKLTLHGFTTSMIDRGFFIFFLILLPLIYKKLNKTFFIYSFIMGMVPALSDNFMSYTRYLLVVFPMFIIFAFKWKKEYHLLIAVMFIFQAIFLVLHSLNYWVG